MPRSLFAATLAFALVATASAASAAEYDLFQAGGPYDGRQMGWDVKAANHAMAFVNFYKNAGVMVIPVGCVQVLVKRPSGTSMKIVDIASKATKWAYNKRFRAGFKPTPACP